MTNKDESAFPIFLQEGLSHNCHVDSGLTKREYFAAMAMQGLLSNAFSKFMALDENSTILVKTAIFYADTLIEQLNKTETK